VLHSVPLKDRTCEAKVGWIWAWVMSTIDVPEAAIFSMISMTLSVVSGSRLAVISSRRRILGEWTRARVLEDGHVGPEVELLEDHADL
jgi:hypothetical protein